MTLAELERGMELHEKRLTRIEDNLVVQGELLNRLDQRLDRVANLLEESQRQRMQDHETLRAMQDAMASLFQRMDAFIRGLERPDGHE
jgi:hypothetical protein